MKKYCSDVVQMAVESKETSPALIGPDLNLIVVTSRYEERLCFVEVYASDGTIMLFEAIYESPHTIIP